MDRELYIDYFDEACVNKLKKLPRLTIQQIDNWFHTSKYEDLYFKINLYGYYGYFKLLDLFNTNTFTKYDLIYTAVRFDKLKLLKYLDQRGIRFIDKKYYYLAVYNSALKIIKYYNGTKINMFKIDNYWDGLYVRCVDSDNCLKTQKYLYSCGVNIHYVNKQGNNLFLQLIAEEFTQPTVFKFFKSKGINIYFKDKWGHNALQIENCVYYKSKVYLKRLYLINRFQNKVFYFYFAQGSKTIFGTKID
jgi:hypothetical protein